MLTIRTKALLRRAWLLLNPSPANLRQLKRARNQAQRQHHFHTEEQLVFPVAKLRLKDNDLNELQKSFAAAMDYESPDFARLQPGNGDKDDRALLVSDNRTTAAG